jgi:acyl-coenzyme A thioesterase 13
MPGSEIDTSQVEGNASPEVKLTLLSALHFMRLSHVSRSTSDKPFRGFESEFASRLRLTEISILSKTEEPEKFEGRVVAQVTVDKGTF